VLREGRPKGGSTGGGIAWRRPGVAQATQTGRGTTIRHNGGAGKKTEAKPPGDIRRKNRSRQQKLNAAKVC